jgi:AraC family transcriptional regulator
MNEVIDFMRMHVDEPVSLPRLAKICGLSTPHFTRAFRETIGQPPHAFLIGLRLEKARDLLEHTPLSITEIAFSCGFEQSQYFATLFRRKLGCAPSEWRRHRSRN